MINYKYIGEKKWDKINANSVERDSELKTMIDKSNKGNDSDKSIIYFDMDGVLANWNHMKSEKHPDGITMEDVFTKGYFKNLEPIEEFIELANTLYEKGMDIRIVSKAKYFAIEEKIEWLNKYLPFISKKHMYFVPLEANKIDFVPTIKPIDILIDDYNPNIDNWTGIAIKAITDKNTINPNYPWITQTNPMYKNLDVITWVWVREYAKNFRKGNENDNDLAYAFEKCSMSKDTFLSVCNGFNIPSNKVNEIINNKENNTIKENDDISIEL